MNELIDIKTANTQSTKQTTTEKKLVMSSQQFKTEYANFNNQINKIIPT